MKMKYYDANIHIMKADKEDLPKILDLQYLAYQSEARLFDNENIPPLQQTLADVENEYQKGIILKVLDEGKNIIGSVRAYCDGGTVYIGKLMVHPSKQGQGIGTQLLLEMEKQYPKKRYELFTSTRSEKNIALYEKLGYKIFDEKQVTEELKFVYMEKVQNIKILGDCKMKEALIIIDVQNDYFPGGTCELCNAYEAEKKIQSLIQESRAQKRPVIYVQHINPPEETFFLEGTYGCEISERIKPLPGDKIIVKYYPNSFHKTELDSYLKENGITKLIVCGMMTHMCVDTTVRAAMDYGYEVELVADACATMDLEISGEIIPAQIVQKTFFASLKDVFAKIV